MIDIEPINARKENSLPVFQPGYVPWFAAQPGEWRGEGADHLRLGRFVHRRPLIRLLEGVSPDGSVSLLQNALAPNRVGGWHIRVGAPESLSILWDHTRLDQRRMIESSHRTACNQVFQDLAGSLAGGASDSGQETLGMIGAAFDHFGWVKSTGLKTDFIVINLGLNLNGPNQEFAHGSVTSQRPRLEEVYEKTLRQSLENRMGLVFSRESPLQIQGVPNDLSAAQAKADLEARLKPQGSLLQRLGLSGPPQNTLWTRKEAKSLIDLCLQRKEIAGRARRLETRNGREGERISMPRRRIKRPKTAKTKKKSQSKSHSH